MSHIQLLHNKIVRYDLFLFDKVYVFEVVSGMFQRRVTGGFGGFQVCYMGSEEFLGGFWRHFMIFGRFQRRHSGVKEAFSRDLGRPSKG